MSREATERTRLSPPLSHPILPEILLEPWPLQRQLLLEIIRPLTERTVGETIVIESRLIGDFGDAEFRNRQIGNRPGSFGLGYDERRIRPPNTSTLQPSSSIHTEYRFLMITEPPRLMSSAAIRVSISRSTS